MTDYVELALGIGRWGRPPLPIPTLEKSLTRLDGWARRAGLRPSLELLAGSEQELALVERAKQMDGLELLVRCEPRSDRFADLARRGVARVLIELPLSPLRAAAAFPSLGVERALAWGPQAVEQALLAGLGVELALDDITRCEEGSVAALIDRCEELGRTRGASLRYRLVDSIGAGDPLSGARRPASLPGWLRWLEQEAGVEPERVTVQAADTRGLGLANSLAAQRARARVATSLFGLGLGAGWAATELLLLHMQREQADLRALAKLRAALAPAPGLFDAHRPPLGRSAWQMVSGTTPETLEPKQRTQLGLDPRPLGASAEPLLDALSGHAGVLHLLHRAHPDLHFQTDDPRIKEVSERMEAQFDAGRSEPVCWEELEPQLRQAGVIDDPDGTKAG